ncbi:hypothetical protein Ahy_B06g086030 [Arachis hypogaea]|uniref:Reverse transcriptase zinc-binding domain-containing protein n=1 Tax=Arachis hypogaea TaxID=3818 RepID=A0A444YWF6_ARAHY|nr:hypothetical protein Ahy_B06g086030 [Arachis hypogaea]
MTNRISLIKIEEGDDHLFWAKTKSEKYEVSSGYQIAYLFYHSPIDYCPKLMQHKATWVELWKMPLLPKIKFFLWRCLHEKLLVLENLHRCIHTISPLCRRCNLSPETICHCLFFCQKSKEAWDRSSLPGLVCGDGSFSFWRTWLESVGKLKRRRSNNRDFQMLAIMCWQIWKSRNRLIFEHDSEGIEQILTSTSNLLQDMQGHIP